MTKGFTAIRQIRHKLQVTCFLCLFPALLQAQVMEQLPKKTTKETAFEIKPFTKKTANKAKTRIQDKSVLPVANVEVMRKPDDKSKRDPVYLEHALALSFDKEKGPDYQLVTGDVCFRHDSARLYCDSAFFYQSTNSLLALGNVHMEQGDTLFLYGAWMYYDGNNKLVKVRENVRLENRDVTLFTDSLNYDRIADIGYFFDGGLLVDENKDGTNELSSEYGQYNTKTKEAWFKNDVKLVNPNFVMTTQQLFYNTATEIASIVSATEVVSDSGYIYTTKGWYNTRTEQSHLLNRSYVTSDNRRLTADTLNYNRLTGVGVSYGRVVIEDSLQQVTLKGDYAYSVDTNDYALLTKHALLIEHSSKDTLYLHADTLSTIRDSIYNTVRAFYGVRFYRSDLQGICDSMFYSTRDSVLRLYNQPVIWSEEQQLTGNFMELFTKNNRPDVLRVEKSAMVIVLERDSLYNQSSGKELKAFFDSSDVVRVEISGNAETVYLPLDKENLIVGLNRLEGSSLTIFRKNGEMEKLLIWPEPKGKFYPLDKLTADQCYLKNFSWYGEARPTDSADVFRKVVINNKPQLSVEDRGRDSEELELPQEDVGKGKKPAFKPGGKSTGRK